MYVSGTLECLDLPSKQQTGHFSSYHYVRPLCMYVRVYVCVCVCERVCVCVCVYVCVAAKSTDQVITISLHMHVCVRLQCCYWECLYIRYAIRLMIDRSSAYM